ncbi:MAG TPA: GNAT family N-acetyltransferase [Bryobacteraceae bacterium]
MKARNGATGRHKSNQPVREWIKELSETKFSVIPARNLTDILRLEPDVNDLLKRTGYSKDLTKTFPYFLATAQAGKGRPFAVAVYRNSLLAGIAYCIKRCLFGIPVGIVECGDLCGDGGILASEEYFDEVADLAWNAILRERFTWLCQLGGMNAAAYPSGREGSGETAARVVSFEIPVHLQLDSTYDAFLSRLGPQTRRNMRYYRRRAERARWEFESNIERREALAGMASLFPAQEIKGNGARLRLSQKVLAELPEAFFSGLRDTNGKWISIMGGWVSEGTAFVLIQLNHARYAKDSVSIVLRSYVLEWMMNAGIRRMKFIGGCEGALKRYCCPMRVSHLLVRRDSYLARLGERIVCRLFPVSKVNYLFSVESARDSLLSRRAAQDDPRA